MKVSQELEMEKKFDVDDGAAVPPLDRLPGVSRVGEGRAHVLEAVYFDTAQFALASRRITLRRRTGGTDAGWHLKLPPEPPADSSAEHQQRRELHAPLGRRTVVPHALMVHLKAYLRGDGVAPVARLKTKRTTYALYGEDGIHLADLADDRVEAVRLEPETGEEQGKQHWREWELELVDGSPGLFAPAREVLGAAGARPAGHASKLARALGTPARVSLPGEGPEEEGGGTALLGKKTPAAAVVSVYVGTQLHQILVSDPGVRLEEPEAVHNMRSAARRIRSVLAAYRKLYSVVPVRRLRDELKWLGGLLGEPRDAEVLQARLREHVDELPPGRGTDAAREHVEREAGATYDAGYRRLQEALDTERYFRLLRDLEAFCRNPTVRPDPVVPGGKVSAKAVDKAARRLRRSHKAATRARRGTDHENALHQVRKDAKRLRHVAEAAALVRGKRARKVAKAAHRQQKILGDFHDAVIARDLLGTTSSDQEMAAPMAAALAALRTRQVEEMDAAEARYRKARRKSRDLLRRGVL